MLTERKSLESRELALINEIAKVLSKGASLDNAVDDTLKIMYSFWDVRYSFVALYNRDLKVLNITHAFGLSKEEIERGIFRKGEGITGKVFKTGIPVVIWDIETNKAFANKTRIREKLKENESFIAVPIRVGGEIIGVLAIFKSFKGKESVERSLEVLIIIGTVLGMFLRLNQKMTEERKEWEEEKRILTRELTGKYNIDNIVGSSPVIRNLIDIIEKVARTDSTVLLLGESGTGKSLFAKTIHALSERKDKPFITINCAAIPEHLLESELFGYEKGAFTGAYASRKGKFELANGGTVFLDEIGDMPLSLQPKILRVIQDKEIERIGGDKTIKVDVRIIAATNRDLKKLVEEGKFREDLYYRLNVIPIYIPSLRERREDIPLLVEYFLDLYNKKHGKRVKITPEALKVMMDYEWSGNVRELENLMERLVVMKDDVIRDIDLPPYILTTRITRERAASNMPQYIERTEREKIIEALERTGYVKSRAAKILGYTLRQLDYRIKKYGIEIKRF